MITATELREWAKQEIAEELAAILREKLMYIFVVDERDALIRQVNMALKPLGYKLNSSNRAVSK